MRIFEFHKLVTNGIIYMRRTDSEINNYQYPHAEVNKLSNYNFIMACRPSCVCCFLSLNACLS